MYNVWLEGVPQSAAHTAGEKIAHLEGKCEEITQNMA